MPRSGSKRVRGIDRYNPIIDEYSIETGWTSEMYWQARDELHKKLFPEKYNEEGERILL